MTTRAKQLTKLLIRVLITTGLLLWVFSRIDIDLKQFSQTISSARWSLLWIIWGLTIVAYWLLSIKMRLILKKQDCYASTWTLFGASAVTSLYGMILPGILDAPVKWYILKQHTGTGSKVFSSMVYNQFTMIVLTGVPALAAVIVTNPTGNWKLPAICSILLILLMAVCSLLLNRTVGPKFTNYLSYIIEPLPTSVRHTGFKILGQLSLFQTAPWSFHLKTFLLNFASLTIVGTAIYIFAAKAARINVPIGMLIWQSAIIFILGRLPISIANLGVREATLIETLALYGVDGLSALLMSMIIFSNSILMAIIGAIFQLCWVFQKRGNNPA